MMMLLRLLQIVRALTPNCRDALRWQSDALERPLSWPQRVGLWIHLIYCVWCVRYGRQLLWLRRTAQHVDHEKDGIMLTGEAKRRMQIAIQAEKIDK